MGDYNGFNHIQCPIFFAGMFGGMKKKSYIYFEKSIKPIATNV